MRWLLVLLLVASCGKDKMSSEAKLNEALQSPAVVLFPAELAEEFNMYAKCNQMQEGEMGGLSTSDMPLFNKQANLIMRNADECRSYANFCSIKKWDASFSYTTTAGPIKCAYYHGVQDCRPYPQSKDIKCDIDTAKDISFLSAF